MSKKALGAVIGGGFLLAKVFTFLVLLFLLFIGVCGVVFIVLSAWDNKDKISSSVRGVIETTSKSMEDN